MKENLSQWIFEDLKKSGLNDSVINEMGVKEIKVKDDLKKYINFASIQGQSIPQATQTYLLPYPDGYNRVKLQFPIEGRKYLSPYGEKGKHIYYLEKEKDKLQSSKYSVIITEGEKKAAKLTQESRKLSNLSAIGFPGVSMIPCSKEEKKIFLDVVSRISGRIFYIAYDSDFRINPDVQTAIAKLALFISVNKGIPKLVTWDATRGKGVDDYLVNFTNPETELANLLEKALENPFKALDRITVENVCHSLATIGTDKEKATEIFERYELKEKFGVSKKTFLSSFREAQKKTAIEEKQNLCSDSNFIEKDGKTYAVKISKDGNVYSEIIADFTARFTKEIVNDENEVSREISIYKNEKTVKLELSSDEISELQLFRKAINKRVIVSYESTTVRQHNEFREFIEQQSKMGEYRKTQYLGMVETDTWSYGNESISKTGKKFLLPTNKMTIKGDDATVKEGLKKVFAYMGGQAWKYLGFLSLTPFCNEIAEIYGFFPLLFFNGYTETGKSQMAEILQAFLGVHKEVRFLTMDSTSNAIERKMGKYKGCPVVLNEYASTEKHNILVCHAYDRERRQKAKTDNSLDTHGGDVNSSVILISTENINGHKASDALSRIIEISTELIDWNEESEKNLSWLYENKDSLSYFIKMLLESDFKNKAKDAIKKEIANTKNYLKKEASARIIINHAMIYAAYQTLCECLQIPYIDYVDDLSVTCAVYTKDSQESSVGFRFVQAVYELCNSKDGLKGASVEDGKLTFSLGMVYHQTLRFIGQSSDKIRIDQKTIAKNLRKIGFSEIGQTRMFGSPSKCWVGSVPASQ